MEDLIRRLIVPRLTIQLGLESVKGNEKGGPCSVKLSSLLND